jgi:uncharacterized protein YutE (UPF0331/DUF86 family)
MNKSSLSDRIFNLIQLFRDSIDINDGNVNIPINKKDQFNELWNSIIEDLMWEPGKLIYINDPNELTSYETIIDIMWHTLDTEEMFNELTSGGYKGLMVDIVDNYIDRAKVIKPIFISIDPEIGDFNIYFNEAMKSYFYGLNKSALILSCSILENILKKKLNKVDDSLVYKLSKKNGKTVVIEFSLKKLINNAATINLISCEEKETAHDIRELRNDAVHKMLHISSDQTYKAIINSKNLIESLLGDKHK